MALPATLSPTSLSPPVYNPEAACSYLSSFTISTDSFISSDNAGRSFASSGNYAFKLRRRADISFMLNVFVTRLIFPPSQCFRRILTDSCIRFTVVEAFISRILDLFFLLYKVRHHLSYILQGCVLPEIILDIPALLQKKRQTILWILLFLKHTSREVLQKLLILSQLLEKHLILAKVNSSSSWTNIQES